MNHNVGVVMAVLSLSLLCGCGSATTPPTAPPQSAPASSASAVVPPTDTPAPIQTAQPLKYLYSFTQSETGGYTFAGTLSLGVIERFTQGLTQGQLTAGSACTINPQTDAVIPGHLSVTNTTNAFSAQAEVEVAPSPSGPFGPVTAFEAGYTSGPACDDLSQSGVEGLTLQSTNALAPHTFIAIDFFVVLANYYSPAHPSGDPSLLAGTTLSLGYTNVPGTSSEISTDSVTGPGGARLNSVLGVFDIPMSAS